MSIFQKIGGFTLGHADIVRRAMSKKKAAALEAERQGFIEGARARNVSPQAAEALFEDMSSFANYAFNKSHAAAYAVISYRTAYLKAHYPREYFAALLTSVLGNATKVSEYIVECEKHAIRVLPPDVNHSRMYFHVSGQDIRFGLLALKNAGKPFVASIIRERERRPFASFEDFVGRMAEYELNKRQVEALIKSGAFDSLGVYRSRLLHSYEKVIDATTSKNRSNVSGQLDMFSSAFGAVSEPAFSYPPIPELTLREKLTMERECSGMYFSGHPVDDYGNHITDLHTVPLSAFVAEAEEGGLSDGKGGYLTDRRRVKVAGVVSSITRKTMKNGDQMAFFTLEDRTGEVECILFAKQYPLLSPYLYVDSPLCVEGSVSIREDEAPKVLVSTLLELSDNRHYQPQPKPTKPVKEIPRQEAVKPTRLFLRLPDRTGTRFRKVENLIGIFDGAFPVILYDSSCSSYFKYPKGLALSDFILGELRELLGDENVILK